MDQVKDDKLYDFSGVQALPSYKSKQNSNSKRFKISHFRKKELHHCHHVHHYSHYQVKQITRTRWAGILCSLWIFNPHNELPGLSCGQWWPLLLPWWSLVSPLQFLWSIYEYQSLINIVGPLCMYSSLISESLCLISLCRFKWHSLFPVSVSIFTDQWLIGPTNQLQISTGI